MKLLEYVATGRSAYAGLASVVDAILQAAIAKEGTLRLQQIQHRAKAVDSLRRKLAKAGAAEDVEIEPHAKDLAGVRLVFYTNSDAGGFSRSGILRANFEIDWQRTKIHHPVGGTHNAADLFVSDNYVVRLREPRSHLPEYADFAGLWCEVQVQTTLNHAWAEMAHDTIYKKPEVLGFGGNLMEGIESRMKEIMRDYLAPAGYAFQKVLIDFERLSRGKALFENGLATTIAAAQDCTDLHEELRKFANSVLPYLDNVEEVAGEILDTVAESVKISRGLQIRPRETPFGALAGKTPDDVAQAAAAIIQEMRFIDPGRTFDVICDLYRNHRSEVEASLWVKLAGELSENHLQVWRQAGAIVQIILMERILGFSVDERRFFQVMIIPVLRNLLSTELSGASSDFDRVTFHRGEVPPSDLLRRLRQDAVAMLYEYEAAASTETERREIVGLFSAAMALRSSGRTPNPDLAAIVYANAAEIITYFTAHIDRWPFELRQKTEHDLLWKYRHYGTAPPSELTHLEAEEARGKFIQAVLSFRVKVNADPSFTTYKLLVGFQSVFPPAWDDRKFDHAAEDAYRKAEIEKLILTVDMDNADAWLATIRRCAATQSEDLATFPNFTHFLERLANSKPEIMLFYLQQLDSRLANFLPPIIRGLSQTHEWPSAQTLIASWIASHCFLADLAWAFGSVAALNLDTFEAIVDGAVETADDRAVRSCVRSISWRDDENDAPRLKALFLRLVSYFADRNDPTWIRAWFSRHERAFIAQALSGQEPSQILASVVTYPEIDHNVEWLLRDIATERPEAVIEYFGLRLQRSLSPDRDAGYEAVPYDFDELGSILRKYPHLIVKAARGWFGENSELFQYRGGKLIKITFPSWDVSLEEALRAYIGTTDPNDKRFVVEILAAYSGEAFLQPIAMDLLALLQPSDPLTDTIEIALDPTGITSGMFGRVERLRIHRESIAAWLSDPRDTVKAFAERYLRQIENSIRAEQQRSEERLAIRQQEYGRKPDPRKAEDDH